jgi:hypothetical protein
MTDRRIEAIEMAGGETLIFADGHDHAIIGVAQAPQGPVVVYDRDAILKALERDGMSVDEAIDFYMFNIECAYVGPQTPLFVHMIR